MRGHRRKPSRGPELPVLDQLPVSVLSDMRYTQSWHNLGLCTLIALSSGAINMAVWQFLLLLLVEVS